MDEAILQIRIWLGVVFLVHGIPKLLPPSSSELPRGFGPLLGNEFATRWSGGRTAAADQFAVLGVPYPAAASLVAGATQVLGAVGMLVGWGARVAALLLVANMAGAVAVRRRSGLVGAHGFEYPMALLVMAAAVAIIGAGQYRIG